MRKLINNIRYTYHRKKGDTYLKKAEACANIVTFDPKSDKFHEYASKAVYHLNWCVQLDI